MDADNKTHGLIGLDLQSIVFPTDRLTVGQLRKVCPTDFEFNWKYKSNNEIRFLDTLLPALHHEREYAARAYATAAGLQAPHIPYFDADELIEMIAEDYKKLGISTGPAHTKQLLRDLEKQAVAQASEGPHR